MPLPTNVSVLEGSSSEEDENEVFVGKSQGVPSRNTNSFATAHDGELDRVINAISKKVKKPSDMRLLELEEREATRARVKLDLTYHVHSLKRNKTVELPEDFDGVATANAKTIAAARRKAEEDALEMKRKEDLMIQENMMTDEELKALAVRMRSELRATGTIQSVIDGDEEYDGNKINANEHDDYSSSDDALDNSSGLGLSFERFRVDVGDITARDVSCAVDRVGGTVSQSGSSTRDDESNEVAVDPFAIPSRLVKIEKALGSVHDIADNTQGTRTAIDGELLKQGEDDILMRFESKMETVDAKLRRLKTGR